MNLLADTFWLSATGVCSQSCLNPHFINHSSKYINGSPVKFHWDKKLEGYLKETVVNEYLKVLD